MIEWDRLTLLLSGTEKEFLFLAPVLLLIGLLFAAIRWRHLLTSLEIRQKIRDLYAYYLVGVFYSIFLPGVMGGDIVRIGICAKESNSSIGIITASVFIERVCGLIILFVMGSVVILWLPSDLLWALGDHVTRGLPAITALCVILVVAGFVIFRRFQDKYLAGKKRKGLVKRLVEMLHPVIRLPYSAFLGVIIFSALFQIAEILTCFTIAKALNIPVSLLLFFVIMPIVVIFTMLPVSLGGLGVREGTLVFLLAKVGVLASDAVALSFLIYLNRIAIGAIGGITQVFWKRREVENPPVPVKKGV
jgi:uncharacterized protein (TIRG00374 family)